MPRIRKLSNQEVASLHPEQPATPENGADAVANPPGDDAAAAPAPAGEAGSAAQGRGRRRRRPPVDEPIEAVPVEAPVAPAPLPVQPTSATDGSHEFVVRPRQAPRQNHIAPPPVVLPEPPEEATVQLLPVELPLAERRGELVHLTLGAGVTLCGTLCNPEPTEARPYSVASGCQRCARMLHRLKARCESCGRPILHVAGNGACIRCGHIGAVIELP